MYDGARRGSGARCRRQSAVPLVPAPRVQVQVAASDTRKQERRIETWGEAVERLSDALAQRDGPERAGLLPVVLYLPVGVDTADVQDARLPVDVASLEREPLGAAEAGAGGDERERSECG
jgi:hypothetical protein